MRSSLCFALLRFTMMMMIMIEDDDKKKWEGERGGDLIYMQMNKSTTKGSGLSSWVSACLP